MKLHMVAPALDEFLDVVEQREVRRNPVAMSATFSHFLEWNEARGREKTFDHLLHQHTMQINSWKLEI